MAETKQPASAAPAPPSNSAAPSNNLDEEDIFEDFPVENWTDEEAQKNGTIWEVNWDDDNLEDDFSQQLAKELQRK